MIFVIVTVALFPSLFTSVDPTFCELSKSLDGPGGDSVLGYTKQGCDIYSRIIYGTSTSLSVGIIVTVLVFVLGIVFGAFAGFYGGWVDAVLSRLTDVMFGFPFLVGAIVILTAFPSRNAYTISFVLIVFGWAGITRIMRSSVFAAKSMDYVQAARALGASNGRIIFRHILPNAITPVLVIATVGVGAVIGAEATLTFLGVGLQAPTNSWGLSISQARGRFVEAPHLLLFPALFLSATVLAFIVLGDAVRDAFDPKLR
jgi:oligopeptide transport system permease protein